MKKQNKIEQKTAERSAEQMLREAFGNLPGEEFFKHKLARIAMWREFRSALVVWLKVLSFFVIGLGCVGGLVFASVRCDSEKQAKKEAASKLVKDVAEISNWRDTHFLDIPTLTYKISVLEQQVHKLERPEPIPTFPHEYYIEVTNSIIHPLLNSSNMFWISRTNQLEFFVTNNIIPTHMNSIWIYKTNY